VIALLIVILMELLLLLPRHIESSQIIPLNATVFLILVSDILIFFWLSNDKLVAYLHYISAINLICLCPIFVTIMWTVIPSSNHALCLYYITMMLSIIYIFKVRFVFVAAVEKFVCFPTWIYLVSKFPDDRTAEISIVLWTSLLIMALFAYDQEYKLKCRFICDESFMRNTEKLKSQLSVLAIKYSDHETGLNWPLDQAIQGIGELLASPDVNIEHIRTLKFIYECLNTSDLVSTSPVKVETMPDDEEQKVRHVFL
jgi:hypothetical protein